MFRFRLLGRIPVRFVVASVGLSTLLNYAVAPSVVGTVDVYQTGRTFVPMEWGDYGASEYVVGSVHEFTNSTGNEVKTRTLTQMFERQAEIVLPRMTSGSVFRVGFPLRFCSFQYSVALDQEPRHEQRLGYIDTWIPRVPVMIVFPTRVRVLPFVVDVAFLAAIVLAVRMSLAALVTRFRLHIARKRGLCACGYPLHGQICPECGMGSESSHR